MCFKFVVPCVALFEYLSLGAQWLSHLRSILQMLSGIQVSRCFRSQTYVRGQGMDADPRDFRPRAVLFVALRNEYLPGAISRGGEETNRAGAGRHRGNSSVNSLVMRVLLTLMSAVYYARADNLTRSITAFNYSGNTHHVASRYVSLISPCH